VGGCNAKGKKRNGRTVGRTERGKGKRAARVGGIETKETNEGRRLRARARPRNRCEDASGTHGWKEKTRTDPTGSHDDDETTRTCTTQVACSRFNTSRRKPMDPNARRRESRCTGCVRRRKERNSRGSETRRQGFGNEGTDAVDPNACTHALHDSDA